MSESLRDQLLKAGLVSKQKVQEHDSRRRKKRKQGKPVDEEIALAAAYSKRAKQEKQEKDKALNEKREAARLRKEIRAKLLQLVKAHSKNDKNADVARSFPHRDKIKRVYLTKKQNQAVAAGSMGLIVVAGRYHVVERKIWEQAAEISAEAGVLLNDLESSEKSAEEDEYAEFQVPDDLTW